MTAYNDLKYYKNAAAFDHAVNKSQTFVNSELIQSLRRYRSKSISSSDEGKSKSSSGTEHRETINHIEEELKEEKAVNNNSFDLELRNSDDEIGFQRDLSEPVI